MNIETEVIYPESVGKRQNAKRERQSGNWQRSERPAWRSKLNLHD